MHLKIIHRALQSAMKCSISSTVPPRSKIPACSTGQIWPDKCLRNHDHALWKGVTVAGERPRASAAAARASGLNPKMRTCSANAASSSSLFADKAYRLSIGVNVLLTLLSTFRGHLPTQLPWDLLPKHALIFRADSAAVVILI
eukprot:SAG31_NODE_661_length_13035_cov_12.057591_3_plen_143_part_00